MTISLEPRFVASPAPSYSVLSHGGGVLLLPNMSGTGLSALGPAYWSETGEQFVAAPIDGAAVNLGATPVVRLMFNGVVTSKGFAFCDVYGHHAAMLSVGATVRLAPSGFVPPPENPRINDLIIAPNGTWWLAGYVNGDEAKGRIYSSPDGKTWTLAVQGKHWALARLLANDGRLIGLQFKQFSEVTPDGIVKLGSAKAHLDDAVFTSNAIVAVGEGLVSVLVTGAKKTKYAPCPVRSNRVRLLATAEGVLLAGQEGLFHATDGLDWKQLSSEPVVALVNSKSGPLVVSPKSEVFALRH